MEAAAVQRAPPVRHHGGGGAHHHEEPEPQQQPEQQQEQPGCDETASGFRNVRHLHAEHDIGKLRVISSNDTMAKKYAMSVLAAFNAEAVTYPLDLTKTRQNCIRNICDFNMQPLYSSQYLNLVGGLSVIRNRLISD